MRTSSNTEYLILLCSNDLTVSATGGSFDNCKKINNIRDAGLRNTSVGDELFSFSLSGSQNVTWMLLSSVDTGKFEVKVTIKLPI